VARLIPKGIAHVAKADDMPTEHFSFLLLPQFSMLAFSAAIEPLRIANQLSGQTLYSWENVSTDGAAVQCSNGTALSADVAIADARTDSSLFVCSGVEPQSHQSKRVSDWVRHGWRRGRIVGGLCTGAYTLAHAGILENSVFTLHWENLDSFRERYPNLSPVEQLYVLDHRILTCGGGAAATDMMVCLIRARHGGALADTILNMCLLQSARPATARQRSATSALLGTRNVRLAAVVDFLHDNLEDEISLKDLSTRFDLSIRQIERLFARYIGTSPKQFLVDVRLERGRALLADTNLAVAEISAAVGFNSSSHFSKRFRLKFGVSPNNFSLSRRTVAGE
jgi:transcriptional regulator GlxA family with amidase domain